MKILIVTGMPGAGKEELLDVARSMGMPFLRMGDLVREYHRTSGAAERGLTVGQVANEERDKHGKDIWARRAMESMSGDVFFVDGCRSMAEVESFRGLSEDVFVIGIHAPRMVRYDRLVRRGRADAPRSISEFDERDQRELGWGIGNVIALSDFMIINDSDLETFRSKARAELEALR